MLRQTTYFDTVDICARKHGGNPESAQARPSNENTAAARNRILEAITESGEHGATCDELAIKWGVSNHTISPRFCELKVNNLIEQKGTRKTRTGKPAGVYVAVRQIT